MKNFYAAVALTGCTLMGLSVSAQSSKKANADRDHGRTLVTTIPQGTFGANVHQANGLKPGIVDTHAGDAARGGTLANDECTGAISLTVEATCTPVSGSSVGATESLPASAVCGDWTSPEANDVWYSFTATSAFTTVDVRGISDFDAIVEVFSGDCSSLTHMACSDNNFPQSPFAADSTESVTVATTVGDLYYVRTYYYSVPIPASMDFTICAYQGDAPPPAPANDECTGAVNQDLVVGSSVTFTGDNTGATNNGEGLDKPAVWEMFTTTECANLELTYCGTTPPFGNGYTAIRQGCPYTSSIAANSFDDSTCTDGNFTLFYLEVPAGVYYYAVMLDPANNAVGPYTITVSASACATPPSNDECAGAVDLTPAVDCIPVAGTTDGATESMPAIPCHGNTSPNARDAWYSFTATETDHTVTVEGIDNFDAVLEVFSGDCSDLTSIACEDSNFPTTGPATEVMALPGLTVGQVYHVRVYDFAHGSTDHNFNICVTTGVPPAQYCVPTTADVSGGDFIANVTLGNINNTTVGDNNYEDYTAQSTMLEQGGSYTLSITSGDYGEDVYAAWIDYNVDSTFQSTEKLGEFAGTTAGELITLPFTVPMDATLGTTRLRVRCAWEETDMDPCWEYSYGEIEDYSVEVTIPTGVRELNSTNVNVFPNPTKGDITISGADLSGTVDFELTDMTGRVVYQEQKSMTANQPVTLPLNGKLAQGTYSLRVITANGISSRAVMIK